MEPIRTWDDYNDFEKLSAMNSWLKKVIEVNAEADKQIDFMMAIKSFLRTDEEIRPIWEAFLLDALRHDRDFYQSSFEIKMMRFIKFLVKRRNKNG